MDIILNAKDGRGGRINKFLQAIVVNKACAYAIHLGSNIKDLQHRGRNVWANQGGKSTLSPRSIAAKTKAHAPLRINEWSGQTKAQATFADGSAEIHASHRGNLITNIIAPDWVPAPGEPGFKGRSGRPLWALDDKFGRNIWQPGAYISPTDLDWSIWRQDLQECSLVEANKNLIMTPTICQKLLKSQPLALGSWSRGSKAKGYARKWH